MTSINTENSVSSHPDIVLDTDDSGRNEILCPCTELTNNGLIAVMGDGIKSYDELLNTVADNGVVIGGKCTACRLDLEHFFTLYQRMKIIKTTKSKKVYIKGEPQSLKQRVYKFLDGLSPMVAQRFVHSAPVFSGNDIRQWVVVVNDSLMFEDQVFASKMDLELTVRNSDGVVVHTSKSELPAGKTFRHDVSQYLDKPAANTLELSSFEIVRRARSVGSRGLTRPQIVIDGAAGTGALHTQNIVGPRRTIHAFFPNLEYQRNFVALVNGSSHPRSFNISYPLSYPLNNAAELMGKGETVTVEVPAGGARLHEIEPSDATLRQIDGGLLRLFCETDDPGPQKMFFVSATKNLDQLSIDHPGG